MSKKATSKKATSKKATSRRQPIGRIIRNAVKRGESGCYRIQPSDVGRSIDQHLGRVLDCDVGRLVVPVRSVSGDVLLYMDGRSDIPKSSEPRTHIQPSGEPLDGMVRSFVSYGQCGAGIPDWETMDEWRKRAHPWTITLEYQRRQMTVYYFTSEDSRRAPTTFDALHSVLLDASAELYESFEEWADELGYDPDSRRALSIYQACCKTAEDVQRLLGDDIEAFLYMDEEDQHDRCLPPVP